jgi:stage II sporulation protein P
MDQKQKTRRFGICMILCACIFRLSMAGATGTLLRHLVRTGTSSILTYLETGRNVRFSASLEKKMDFFRESPVPWVPRPEKPRFSREDAALVEMDYDCTYRPDLEALITQPLDWDLTGKEPTVLILHTHTTESYTMDEETYVETSAYRTLDEAHNMLSIGDAVTKLLTGEGISVIHDRQIHDYPSYSGSYVHSRASAEEILTQYPSIRIILDLHRDALEKEGRQYRPLAQVDGISAAQLMFVVGTDVSRRSHQNWQENLALALKLQIQLERIAPGMMRPVNLRAQRFNQDLSPGALLVEVGAAGNTREEAQKAAEILAKAIISLSKGTGK